MQTHDLSAHLDDIGFGEGFEGGALGARGHVGVIEEGLWRRGGGHEMDEVVEGEWWEVLAHGRRRLGDGRPRSNGGRNQKLMAKQRQLERADWVT